MEQTTEIKKRNILRLNNHESNRITCECIEIALFRLMEQKAYSEISITDIIKVAGVSRSSYYRNYTSKDDILGKYIQTINNNLSDALLQYDVVQDNRKIWEIILKTVSRFAPKYKLIIQAGFCAKLTQELIMRMNASVSGSDYALYYSNVYWAGAISTVITEWVKNDMNVPASALADICSNLMLNGIHTIADYNNSCKPSAAL